MKRIPAKRVFLLAALLLLPLLSRPARGGDFVVTLELSNGTSSQTADTQTDPPVAREAAERPKLESKAGSRCTAKFKLVCESKKQLKDVLVHCYAVKIDKIGQAPPPLDPKVVLIETAQTMDFSAGVSTSAELQFVPQQAGIYLLRVETQGTAEQTSREFYAAIDVVVK